MCGLCGIINFNGAPVEESVIRKMMRLQKHRGPDDEGIFLEKNTGLGFVRLSIIDLSSAGHQPMSSPDGRYVMVFNGEIFNYIELREELKALGHRFVSGSDTEVLLAAFIQWGEESLHRFNGMWAFAIYDRESGRLFAARDRYGIKPLYYATDGKCLMFASELPPLISVFPGGTGPNDQAVYDFLVFNRTEHTAETFFKNIMKVRHGHLLEVKPAEVSGGYSVSVSRWYDLRLEAARAEPIADASEFTDLLSASVGLRLRSDVPVGVCLSGGLDSSSIVSLVLGRHRKNLQTFSAVYNKGQYGDESEFINEYAGRVNRMFFTNPDAITLTQDLKNFVRMHAEPVPATGVYAQYKVMELARGHVVVTLDGQGADEMLAGYHYFFGFFFKDLLRKVRLGMLSHEMYCYLRNHHSVYGLKSFAYLLLPEAIRRKLILGSRGYLSDAFTSDFSKQRSEAENLYDPDNLQDALFNHFEYKLEHLLKWEDRNSMYFSLEARVPFLDHNLVERCLATEGLDRIKNGMTKAVLREGMKGIVPEKIRLRKDKIGFGTPQNEWLREPFFRDLLKDILGRESMIGGKYVNTENAEAIYDAHLKGKADNSKEIWKMINLEMWMREFFG